MKQESPAFIGSIMLIGALVSAVFALLGGVAYLMEHGNDIANYEKFNPLLSHVKNYFSPNGFIELGIFTLVFTQLLRVALVTWLFIKEKNWAFVIFSLFVLAILIASFYT